MMRENPSGSTYPCGKDLDVFAFLHISKVDSEIFYDFFSWDTNDLRGVCVLSVRSVTDLFSFPCSQFCVLFFVSCVDFGSLFVVLFTCCVFCA